MKPLNEMTLLDIKYLPAGDHMNRLVVQEMGGRVSESAGGYVRSFYEDGNEITQRTESPSGDLRDAIRVWEALPLRTPDGSISIGYALLKGTNFGRPFETIRMDFGADYAPVYIEKGDLARKICVAYLFAKSATDDALRACWCLTSPR